MLIAMKYAVKAAPAPAPTDGGGKTAPAAPKPAAAPVTESAPAPVETPAPAAEPEPVPEADPFCKPWAEHNIEFDPEGIRAKGFVRSEQTTLGGVNGYNFYTADGSARFIRPEMAIIQKLAKKL